LLDRLRNCCRVPVLLALGGIILALISAAVSPNRLSIAVVAVPLATGFYLLSATRQRQVWFALLPWAVLLNQVPLQSGAPNGMPFYHSEAVLLLLGAILALNLRTISTNSRAANSFVVAFAAWVVLAALVGVSRSGWEATLSAWRVAILALLSFRAAAEGI
jgi:hypothetical protein